ncbi:recombinase family protein [Schaalia cardiffensis]|uniref:recombinase family protein n=1 Tax=Schaalia cardiffensis TaxID=181487 RepID=UPI002AB227EA|nr:recombinase family protein [Schaalia cardiffensis]
MKTTSSQPVRAAIYLRISLDREMDGLAIDRQREDCEKLAQFRGWEIVETYVDQSISASGKTKKRPAYLRMVQDYEAGLIDAIVVYDLDRLTRQPRELEDWIDRAESRGLLLVTANGDADLATDGGRMYARIKAAVARNEVERKGARQSRAQIQRARQGRPPKGVRPMGYTTAGELIQDEAEAVRAIYAAFLRGDSLRGIARALSGAQSDGEGTGVPCVPLHSRTIVLERNVRRQAEGKSPRPVPEDKPWSTSTVLGILRNPRYAGYSVYTSKDTRRQEAGESRRKALRDNLVKDENGELVLGQWKAIVEADQWWTVQNLLDDPSRVTNRSGSTVRKHLGAGLYRCGECGEPVRTRARYYSCNAGHLNRTRDAIDDFVRALVVARLQKKDLRRRKKQADPEVKDAFSEQIAQQRARIARAERDYDAEVIEGADLSRIRTAARAEITRLEAERLASGTGTVLAPILGTPDPAMAFLAAPIALQRTMIDTLMTVTLKRAKQGKKGFDPESVEIVWK